ncbi:hypothetical protein N8856_05360 [Candidatus Pelagibacter ubique]|jgi:hypothetical protein|nr:hypothetical protein [Candidatus Pelagibacter ubique]
MDFLDLFEKNGVVIIKNVFEKKKILEYRNSLENNFKNKNNPNLLNIFELDHRNEILNDLFLNEDLIKKIYSIFDKEKYGEIYILPPFQIMKSNLLKLSRHTWHIDASGEYRYNSSKEKIYKKNYLFGKVGIYLQNNTEFGGQIDVIKKSNHIYGKYNFNSILKKIFIKIKMRIVRSMNSKLKFKYEKKILNYERLQLDLGDIVIFDSRTYHRGSPILSDIEDKVFNTQGHYSDQVDINKNKLRIYFQFGNQLGLESYLIDRTQRAESEEEKICWDKTKNVIRNFYEMQNIPPPICISKSLKKMFFK